MTHPWNQPPTKRELMERIDAFLRAFNEGELAKAFQICPPLVYEKEKGMVLRKDLSRDELAENLSHAMFQFIEGQSIVEGDLAGVDGAKPETWCKLVTPPKDVDYVDLSLDFPGGGEDAADDTRATGEGEVLANVHLKGEVTDITGRYALTNENGGWLLAFSNFDIM